MHGMLEASRSLYKRRELAGCDCCRLSCAAGCLLSSVQAGGERGITKPLPSK